MDTKNNIARYPNKVFLSIVDHSVRTIKVFRLVC
jgi:hypothetical protein